MPLNKGSLLDADALGLGFIPNDFENEIQWI